VSVGDVGAVTNVSSWEDPPTDEVPEEDTGGLLLGKTPGIAICKFGLGEDEINKWSAAIDEPWLGEVGGTLLP
jgi:hypothetical protein